MADPSKPTNDTWLEEGSKAPDFTLASDQGPPVKLGGLRGGPVVVYFYPRDDTPGCTREACAFRDRSGELKAHGATVLGISTDDVKSHGKFRDKFSLNFPLLADVDHKTAEAFGAWREKNMYGKKSMGIQRSTFLIDGAGIVRKVWRKVNVDGHDAEVLAALDALGAKPEKPKATATKTAPVKKAVAKSPPTKVAKKKTTKKKK
ncbi:MAG: thioredoxin-dependent thiol peroxidase [Planctomycetia bacterium]|nr:thioredoxin-dependent thiol peroxidase [Planctomycetia bacterium]